VVLRLTDPIAQAMQRSAGRPTLLKPGQECQIAWAPSPRTKVEPTLPSGPITGRLIHARIEHVGFRPVDLYLFTTLLDPIQYPATDICELYGQRLQVEICLRHIKTSLAMDEFDVRSAAMFRKELAAGLLAYNLICAFIVKAALPNQLRPNQLSFKRCWRRVRDILLNGLPAWVDGRTAAQTYFLNRLSKCRLPYQPNKVKYEPRMARRRPDVFPALKATRDEARRQVINQFSLSSIS
jgi:hypothetical protein